MRLGRWFGIPIRISILTLPMLVLALWADEGRRMLAMSGSILFHELMHVLAARLLRIRVLEIELMPCGGAARLENLWRLRPGQMAAVALAGPLGNLVLMTLGAALCWWGMVSREWAAVVIEQNAVIFVFNLLPALPMDGGRVMCGWLSRRLSPAAAAKAGGYTALALAGILLGLAAYGMKKGQVNITLIVSALFLLVSVRREHRQAEYAAIESMIGRSAELENERVMPIRWLAVREDTTMREAAVCLRPGYMHMLAVYDEDMTMCAAVEEGVLMRALMIDSDMKMDECKEKVKLKKVEKKC